MRIHDDDDDDLDVDFDDPMARKHPELYGKLLEVNAALQDAGGVLIVPYLILLLSICAAIWMDWYRAIPGFKDVNLDSFWIYAIITVMVVSIWIGHFNMVQRACYRRYREGLLEVIRKTGVRRYPLLAMLVNNKPIAEVTSFLQRDHWDEP